MGAARIETCSAVSCSACLLCLLCGARFNSHRFACGLQGCQMWTHFQCACRPACSRMIHTHSYSYIDHLSAPTRLMKQSFYDRPEPAVERCKHNNAFDVKNFSLSEHAFCCIPIADCSFPLGAPRVRVSLYSVIPPPHRASNGRTGCISDSGRCDAVACARCVCRSADWP